MSEIVVTGVKLLFLALLWIFILFVVNVIRTDLSEVYNPASEKQLSRRERRRKKQKKQHSLTKLTVVSGQSTGSSVPLAGVVSIGRGYECALMIDDSYASEKHAQIRLADDGSWVIEDLLSTNGTYVNEVPVSEPTVVTDKDVIRIGRTELRLEN